MNKKTAKDYLPLVQALADGKKIQVISSGGWRDIVEPGFNLPAERYRIKPESKEIWVNEYANTGVAAHTSKDAAVRNAGVAATRKAVRYREVLDE